MSENMEVLGIFHFFGSMGGMEDINGGLVLRDEDRFWDIFILISEDFEKSYF